MGKITLHKTKIMWCFKEIPVTSSLANGLISSSFSIKTVNLILILRIASTSITQTHKQLM